MRRAAAIIIVFLIIGAVANFAVAWACEHFFDVRILDTTLIAKVRREEFARADREPNVVNDRWVKEAFRAPGIEMIRYSENGLQSEVRRTGWPWRSLVCVVEYRLDRSTGSSNWKRQVHGGLLLSGFAFLSRDVTGSTTRGMQATERVLPLRPIWLGLVSNMMFWGGLLWVLWDDSSVDAQRVLGISSPMHALRLSGRHFSGVH